MKEKETPKTVKKAPAKQPEAPAKASAEKATVKPAEKPKKSAQKPSKSEPKMNLKDAKSARKMNLDKSRTLISKIFLGLVLFCLTFFFARTAIWEYNYYKEKEGSERATAESVEVETQDLDETEVTDAEKAEYTVPADHPRYLSIEKLGVRNARVLAMGLNTAGELDTPNNIFDVGWYRQSSKPGSGGVIVIDGHNGGPNIEGVFKHTNTLYVGDLIVIERGDGEKFTYKVVENNEIPLSEADEYMHVAFTSPVPGTEALTLITCIGEWSQVQGTYLSRQFTRAILAE